MSRPNLPTQFGYYGVIYLILVLITVIGYGPAQEFAKPITNLIFPEYTEGSILKTIIVVTLFYWVAVCAFGINWPKKGE